MFCFSFSDTTHPRKRYTKPRKTYTSIGMKRGYPIPE